MAVTDAEIRMWAMDRALDSFNRKNWADAFLKAIILFNWAKESVAPPLLDNGELDVEKFFASKTNEGGVDG